MNTIKTINKASSQNFGIMLDGENNENFILIYVCVSIYIYDYLNKTAYKNL